MQTTILPFRSTSFRSSRPNFFDTVPWPTKTSGALTCRSAKVPSEDQSFPYTSGAPSTLTFVGSTNSVATSGTCW